MNLLPCPSCGSPAIGPKKSSSGDERNGYNFTVTIRCECGFNASRPSREDRGGWCIDKGEAEAELIALWNKRTPVGIERVPQTMIDRIRGYGRDFAFSGSFAGDMEAVADILAKAKPNVLPDELLKGKVTFARLGVVDIHVDQSYFGKHMVGEGDDVLIYNVSKAG